MGVQCELCQLEFNEFSVKEHVKTCQKYNEYIKKNVTEHTRTGKQLVTFSCHLCDKEILSQRGIFQHLTMKHFPKDPTNKEMKSFKSSSNDNDHEVIDIESEEQVSDDDNFDYLDEDIEDGAKAELQVSLKKVSPVSNEEKDELWTNRNRAVIALIPTSNRHLESDDEDSSVDKDVNENEHREVPDTLEFKIESVRGSIAELESPSPLQMNNHKNTGDANGNGDKSNEKSITKDPDESNTADLEDVSDKNPVVQNPGFVGSIQNIFYCDLCDTAFISEEFVIEHIRKYHKVLKRNWKQFVSDHCL